MFRALVIILSFFAATTVAYANSCLEQVSNSELLQEVEFRMGTTTGPTTSIFVNFSCQGNRLNLSTINNVGTENKARYFTNGNSSCNDYVAKMTETFGSKINQSVIIGVCQGNRMKRSMIRRDGTIKDLSDQLHNGNNSCREAAFATIEGNQ